MSTASSSLYDEVEAEIERTREDLIENCLIFEENISDMSSLEEDVQDMKEKGNSLDTRSFRLEKQMQCLSMSCTILMITLVVAAISGGVYWLVHHANEHQN